MLSEDAEGCAEGSGKLSESPACTADGSKNIQRVLTAILLPNAEISIAISGFSTG